jgi:UDP-N-acetylmuramoyl-tripeptide--D-alanyl-D-alanine ligase
MLNFTIKDIEAATGGEALRGAAGLPVSSISTDSREIAEGEWFLALKGPNFNGHDHISAAIEKGAAGLIVSSPPGDIGAVPENVSILLVGDTLEALGDIAIAWRIKTGPKVACIAGSGGKTTTKDMAAAVLADSPGSLVSEKNFNNLIGLPKTLLKLTGGDKLVLAELGMNEMGELSRLTEIADPDIAALTNIGEAHIGKFGSLEALMRAKAELIVGMKPGARLIANADCLRSAEIVEQYAGRLDVIHFGMACHAPYRADNIVPLSPWGYAFDFSCPNGKTRMEVHAFGRHNVANAVCASALLCELGIDPEKAAEGISRFRPGAMRSHAQEVNGVLLIEDCYNASPSAVLSAIQSLSDLRIEGKIFLALGDMLELGAMEEEYHRKIGAAAARLKDARICAVGQRGRWIAEEALENGASAAWFSSVEEAAESIACSVAPGDAALLKASRLMEFEKLAQSLRRRIQRNAQGDV